MLPESFLTELKYRSDIVEVLSAYLPLKRAGRSVKGLCPFHSERSPSFTVYPESQSFYCFGCGAGGDVITFVKKVENLEYMEAVRFLAQRAGIPVPEDAQEDGTARLRGRILEMNRHAARFFHDTLFSPAGEQARAYLVGRGLSRATVTRFGLGYAPDSWDSLRNFLREKGYSFEEMEKAALVVNRNGKSYYDSFRGRVIFPIIDLRGNVIAFGGRIMGEGGPKYLNSGDTLVFKKSRNLFALNLAKNTKEPQMILAEGYMDVVSLHQAGFANAVAALGTAFTAEQARLLSQYVKEVVLAYDSDGAGQAATKRANALLDEAGIKVRVLSIPDAKDPDEYIKKFGAGRFKMLLEGSRNATEYEIGKLSAKYDCSTEDGKVGFLKEFSGLMAGIQNPIEREVYIGKWAQELSVNREAIAAQVTSLQKQRRKAAEKKDLRDTAVFLQKAPQAKQDLQRSRHIKYALAEDRLIMLLWRNPDFAAHLQQKLPPEKWVTDFNRELYTALATRMRENQSVDMSSLSQVLSEEQLARLSWLLAASHDTQGEGKTELDGYIETILAFSLEKTSTQVAEMNEQELEEYIRQISANKK